MNKYYFIIISPDFEFHEFTNYMWLLDYLQYAEEKKQLDKCIYKIIEGKEILKGEDNE